MNQKKMRLLKATNFIEEVKRSIMKIADEYDIEVAKDCVEPDISTVLIHEDGADIGGNYGSVELRVYWEV